MSNKWIRKYMLLAKTLADDNTACYSRKIGVVLVNDKNRIISLGYNGSVEGAPHTDDPVYLEKVYPILTKEETEYLQKHYNVKTKNEFVEKFSHCKNCPRKLLNIPSGARLELCNCGHAERNCLASANKIGVSTENSTMYCWCSLPCHECGIQMIQSGVKKVVCLKSDVDYSPSTRFNFIFSNIDLIELDESFFQ